MQPGWRVLGEDWIANPGTVVAGVDGSGRDRGAVLWAAAEAARQGSDLLLVTVVDDSLLVSPSASLALWRTGAEEVLDEAARVVDGTVPRENLHRLVLAGDPAVCLARRFPDVRLVVVGKRGLGTLERMLLGSTSLGLVARSEAPVVVVPDEWEPGRNSRGPVVVAVVSEHEERKLALASVRAARLGVPLVTVHAEDPEQPGDAILRAATGAQLVVIGRAARRGLPGVLLGPTVKVVLRGAECPVVVVPERDTQEGTNMNGSSGRAVLVAIDDGETRHIALEFGARQAMAEGRGLHLVHVVHPLTKTFGAGGPPEVAGAMAAAAALLEEAATVARQITGESVDITTSALEGYPLEALLHAAGASDRIVLQRRHLTPLDNLINGPVVAGVSARAEVPVVVVPETAPGWSEPGHRRVTVAVKHWDRDADLLDRAFDEAAAMAARLRVLTVARHLPLGGRQDEDDLLGTTELHLREQVQDRHALHPEVDVEVVVRAGKPALVLLEASMDTDLMLISRPPTHLRANALGTLSRALIREAVCAVEVVPTRARVLAPAPATPHPPAGADAWGPIY